MAIITLKFEKDSEDGLYYLTDGTSIEGFEVIDGKLYNSKGIYSGEIINMNQNNNFMIVELRLERWLLNNK